jgi:hypothetical protein
MKFIVEYIEDGSDKFRAIEVECDDEKYADVEAMKLGADIKKVKRVYLAKEKMK